MVFTCPTIEVEVNWLDLTLNLVKPNKDHANIPVLYAIQAMFLVLSSVITFNTEVHAELESFQAVDGSYMNSAANVKGVVAVAKLLLFINPLAVSLLGLGLSYLVFKGTKPRYTDVLSIVLRGEIVCVVGMILIAPLIVITNNVNVSFSLAPLVLMLGYKPSSDLFYLLSRLNLFFILEVMVVGSGLSRLCCCSTKDGLLIAMLSVGSFSILLMLIRLL